MVLYVTVEQSPFQNFVIGFYSLLQFPLQLFRLTVGGMFHGYIIKWNLDPAANACY